jgi:hypothetical protein
VKRVVVLGGTGFFGGLIVERLRTAGLEPVVASRSGAIRIDANNSDDLRSHLKQRDLVIDAAGPYHQRTPALIEAAARIGFDVIDLNDAAAYAALVMERAAPIASAGIRVLNSCSAISAVSGAVLAMSSVKQPRRLTAYFRPPAHLSRERGCVAAMAPAATATTVRKMQFPEPLGLRSGVVLRSADSVTLPAVFPTLRDAELVFDSGIPGAYSPLLRDIVSRFPKLALRFVPRAGVLAYEIVETGAVRQQLFVGENVHLTAVLPAVMAAQSIVAGKFPHRGLVPASQQVNAEVLFDALYREGVAVLPPWGT